MKIVRLSSIFALSDLTDFYQICELVVKLCPAAGRLDADLWLTFPYPSRRTRSSLDSHDTGDKRPSIQEFKCEGKCLLRGRSTFPWPG